MQTLKIALRPLGICPYSNSLQLNMAQKCVHQSCGKMFTDPEEECNYHPGPPIFHEGQKGEFDTDFDISKLFFKSQTSTRTILIEMYRLEMLQAPRPNLRRIPLHHTLHHRQAQHDRSPPYNRKEARRSSRNLPRRLSTSCSCPSSSSQSSPSPGPSSPFYPATTPTRVRGRRTQLGDSKRQDM